jgi:6-phosphogluconolactonase
MTTTIKIFNDIYKLSRAGAEFFVTLSKKAIRERGRFAVALCGGVTPESLYALLATSAYASRIDWSKVHVFWSDERAVPQKNMDSNYRMAHYALLSAVPLPPENIHRVRGELKPEEAAANYEHDLRAFFGEEAPYPRFDLIFLGLAEDGQTGALVPYASILAPSDRWAQASFQEERNAWWVGLGPASLNAAANILVLVTGASKAARLREVLEGEREPERLPLQLIQPRDGRLVWLLDLEAASQLRSTQNDPTDLD